MCSPAEAPPLFHQLKFLKIDDRTVRVVETVSAKGWTELAYVLNFADSRVQIIKRNHRDDCMEACEEMLRVWLAEGREVTWERLIVALKDAKLGTLADTLQELLHNHSSH